MTLTPPALFPFYAAVPEMDVKSFLEPVRSSNSSLKESMVVVTILVVVALILILAVIISRRKKIRRLSGLSRSAWPASASKNHDPGGAPLRSGKSRHRRHRHHRHENRPRNPTLADTGGLPPRRPEGQPPPGP
jgi:hypothetical protein